MMDTARWPFARFADGAAGPIVCSQSLLLHQYLMLSSTSHGADSARQHPRGAFPSRLPLYMHSPRRLDLPTSFLLSLFSSRLLHKSERAKNPILVGKLCIKRQASGYRYLVPHLPNLQRPIFAADSGTVRNYVFNDVCVQSYRFLLAVSSTPMRQLP